MVMFRAFFSMSVLHREHNPNHKTFFFLLTLIKTNHGEKFHENPSSGIRSVPYGQTDERNGMTQLVVTFLNCFANAFKPTKYLSITRPKKPVSPEYKSNALPLHQNCYKKEHVLYSGVAMLQIDLTLLVERLALFVV